VTRPSPPTETLTVASRSQVILSPSTSLSARSVQTPVDALIVIVSEAEVRSSERK